MDLNLVTLGVCHGMDVRVSGGLPRDRLSNGAQIHNRFHPVRCPLHAYLLVLSLDLLGLALKALPLGTAYAIWIGIGTIGTAAVVIVLLHESADPLRLGCIGLILSGIVGLELVSAEMGDTGRRDSAERRRTAAHRRLISANRKAGF